MTLNFDSFTDLSGGFLVAERCFPYEVPHQEVASPTSLPDKLTALHYLTHMAKVGLHRNRLLRTVEIKRTKTLLCSCVFIALDGSTVRTISIHASLCVTDGIL
ncbi:unnamed protein product [Leptidea sinapis]|uniref:Uncharacterized protein n=1 Tax=Leptidea sinapis TaxID=189913 RepID=A0A5E4QLV9_9NEOP|nr:unnamed protein product [Leptidea sinapis]